MFTQGCRLRSNPGLKLANTFGVRNVAVVVMRHLGGPRLGLELANTFGVRNVDSLFIRHIDVHAGAGISEHLRR
jgi:hypothetical protein